MAFREFLLLYKYTWISFAVFFALSAISMALDNIIPQFFAAMFAFSTALSFLSIFVVNTVILTKFRKNKRYIKLYNKVYTDNNNAPSKHESSTDEYKSPDYINDPQYRYTSGNIYYNGD